MKLGILMPFVIFWSTTVSPCVSTLIIEKIIDDINKLICFLSDDSLPWPTYRITHHVDNSLFSV